jgi:PAS domain S-box-containing protein
MMNRVEFKEVNTEFPNSKELLNQILDNAQVAIVIADNNAVITHVNPEFTNIFGFRPEEAKGKTIGKLLIPEACRQQIEPLKSRLDTGDRVEYESMRRAKDGRLIPVLCRTNEWNIKGSKRTAHLFISKHRYQGFSTTGSRHLSFIPGTSPNAGRHRRIWKGPSNVLKPRIDRKANFWPT